MKTVVVTGASGYIGGQTAIAFSDAGYNVIGIDREHPPKHLNSYFVKFMISEFSSEESLYLIAQNNPVAIVHCAGTSLVGPSRRNPEVYYQNNFVATKILADFLVSNNIKTKIIFSSSASVYGEPVLPPCKEEDPPLPLSPYGESKLMVEMLLKSYNKAYGLDSVILRYFNVCGADSQGRHGQAVGATHLIARTMESIRDNKNITIYGKNYPTQDGTCVRDYIHVEDIAHAHLLAVDCSHDVYNLGRGSGNSNLEIVQTALEVTNNQSKQIQWGDKRSGDPSMLTADSEKFSKQSGWIPTHNLQSIISTAWNWYTK